MSALNDSLGLSGGVRMADDYVIMPLQCATQWDGLAHVAYDDYIYNGYPATSVTAGGASRNAIDKLASGVAGRGVLLDVATYMNVPWLEPGYVITPADLDATLAWQGDVAVGAGDIVLIRTGVRRALLDPTVADDFRTAKPGLGIDCCEWLRTRDVAAVASDNNAVEVLPSEDPEFALPLHCVLIRDVGMTLGEIFYLEELSADCQKDGIWDFFFCAPPLPVSNAVGSPINPLAIKWAKGLNRDTQRTNVIVDGGCQCHPVQTSQNYNDLVSKHGSEDPQAARVENTPLQIYHGLLEIPVRDTMAALTLHNLFGRFPKVQILSIELGSAWVRPLLKDLDRAVKFGATGQQIGGPLPELPSETWREDSREVSSWGEWLFQDAWSRVTW
jgi:kynurenine formamidase